MRPLLEAALPLLRQDPCPDAELLARFLDDRDEAAFEALVVRHAPAVRAACRGWLRSAADIDDAAQATFLVLVRRAGTIRDGAALGRWLYRVADNVARRLRRQRAHAPLPADLPGREPAGDDDLRDLLAAEVARLPEKYRLPVQLCYWVGLSTAEAAGRLGWPRGTVLTRLAGARDRLRRRLTRQGLAPAAVAAVALTAAPAVSGRWVRATARAAKLLLAGGSPAGAGVSQRTVSLTEGVVRAMTYDRLKYIALAALVALGLVGVGVRYGASAPNESLTAGEQRAAPAAADRDAAKANEARPVVPGRRREAVIRLPAGSFAKEVEVAPYGSGRLTWTYEEDRVLGLIEASVMGFEVELATEAEYALSSNGTIYGLITGVRLNHVRVPDGEPWPQLKPFAGLWPVAEPLVQEVLLDLPFSYRFRVQGDRLVLSNFRILLAGPNPLGKLGGLVGAGGGSGNEAFVTLTAFQALGTALEGTYTAADAREKPALGKRPLFTGPRSRPPQKKK
jgi:RNA polymerase sigma factor (sigma-70 family)